MFVLHQSCPQRTFLVQCFANGNSPWWGTIIGNAMNQKKFEFFIFSNGVLDGNWATFPLFFAFVVNDFFLQVCVFGGSLTLYGKICRGYGEEN
jgi:hypothetical protein